MAKEPKKRAGAEQLLMHPWIQAAATQAEQFVQSIGLEIRPPTKACLGLVKLRLNNWGDAGQQHTFAEFEKTAD